MSKILIPLTLGFLCASFISSDHYRAQDNSFSISVPVFNTVSGKDAHTVYNNCNLSQFGLSEEAFDYAWKGYQYLLEKNRISRQEYLTICDFSKSSAKKRLYIIDINNNKLLTHTFVAHGKNSGYEYATKFSNKLQSLQSSLGFYITANTYQGKHGLSLRLQGVDPGYNDKAMERTIVMHGADYVDEGRAKAGVFMGRSWGCPAVSKKESAQIITTIKNGSCLFIYHPDRDYLNGSKILNP